MLIVTDAQKFPVVSMYVRMQREARHLYCLYCSAVYMWWERAQVTQTTVAVSLLLLVACGGAFDHLCFHFILDGSNTTPTTASSYNNDYDHEHNNSDDDDNDKRTTPRRCAGLLQ
ncbi:hypothetical protein JKP88DRAFT_242084 [Tribonema minus]|uniref:Uncharacterized protein n=1 Tax=Tribonema minus TaxID=303371 RepID=A0A835YVJ0_9STRA|nr:hypothetical protein JKP88DRAFT_242084 [Tribonema minus]